MHGIGLVILLSSVVGQAGQTATPLDEFGATMVGRWKGDVTLAIDLEGFGKRGEKSVNYLSFRWIADKRAIESDFHCAAAAGRGLTFWDAAAKSLRERCVSSDGRTYELTIVKDGKNWAWSLRGSLSDGKVLTGNGHYIIQNEGKKFVSEGVLSVDGEELPSFRDEYIRLN